MLITSKVMLPPSEKLDLTFFLNMIRKDVVYLAIIVVLLVIVAVMTCQSPPTDPSAILYADSIKELKSQKAFKAAQFDSVSTVANVLVKEKDSVVAALSKEIASNKVKAATRRPQVLPVIDSIPALNAFVEVLDSTILTQDILIDTLKNQLAFERNVREQLVALHYDQAKIESQMSELKDQRIIALEKDLKKERRRGKLKAVLIPIVGVAAFLLGSQF